MTNNMPSGVKNITKVLNQKVAKQPNCFSFFFFTMVHGDMERLCQYCIHLLVEACEDRLAAL